MSTSASIAPVASAPSVERLHWAWWVWLGAPTLIACVAGVGIFLLDPYVDSAYLLLVRGHDAETMTAWLWLVICGCMGLLCVVLAVRVSMTCRYGVAVLMWLGTGVALLALTCVAFVAWLMGVGAAMSTYVPLDDLARPAGRQILVEERHSLHWHMSYAIWQGGPRVYSPADVPEILDVRTRGEQPMVDGDFRVETADDGSSVLVLLGHRITLP
ncbi:hypothetical protein [Oerskovia paurometabola]|uniref:hypothetical protein n=1 Tax=Oerskovia paurometabola TaxID=162170 RepID=UPI0038258BB7